MINPSAMRLYNTFTRAKEELTPIRAGSVRIYSCGPTVYRYVHVGNLRTFMLPDLLRRSLEYLGYRTEQVMNITDVGHLTDDMFDRGEDKMLVSARLENKSPEEISAYYTQAFMDDAARLNIRRAAHYPQATQYVAQMIDLITRLIAKGHAYDVGGTVYYDIASFPAYGKLSRNTTDKLLAGARGEVDPRKHHPGDFTLWKAAGAHRLQVWPSPWGPGFPGWHIECSAMSMSLLGERFDIHTGGADNVFPHHEAEIAQSEGVTGQRVVSCWLHGGLLMLAGSRMAKSAGNFFRITELEQQGFDPLAFRYLALQAKYRTKLNFSIEGLAGAHRALTQLRERLADWSRGPSAFDAQATDVAGFEARFRSAIADDLDLPAVMALVAELTRSPAAPGAKAALLREWDRVLGLDLDRSVPIQALPDGAAALLEARLKARDAKDFEKSDRLREELAAMGVAVTDTSEGQRWKVPGHKAIDK
ncbi:MAG TPA: cysteine--tRNA ligase [Candidatus Dormibacteraeota bacterium]|nr:cysteine--tRNA ligase [Candidatus Dormibacteraeota bacterium]